MDSTFTDEAREALRARELEAIGSRYSPLVHWLAPIAFGVLVAGCAAATLDHVHGAECSRSR